MLTLMFTVFVALPAALLTVSVTVKVLLFAGPFHTKVCEGFWALLCAEPSPKFQSHAVMGQLMAWDRSVNVTASGLVPWVLDAVKSASGDSQAGVGDGVALGLGVAESDELALGLGVSVGAGPDDGGGAGVGGTGVGSGG